MANQDDYIRITLRIPKDLHGRLSELAEETSKSMNAEIIGRLEASVLAESLDVALLPASKARQIAGASRKKMVGVVQNRVITGINRSVSLGLSAAHVDLRDLDIESLTEQHFDEVMIPIQKQLEQAGYKYEMDGGDSISIWFD